MKPTKTSSNQTKATAMKPSNEPVQPKPSFQPAHRQGRQFLIVAIDSPRDIDNAEIVFVLTCARDARKALARSRMALRLGSVPLGALEVADLRRLADCLEQHPQKPGQAYNLTLGMTEDELQVDEDRKWLELMDKMEAEEAEEAAIA